MSNLVQKNKLCRSYDEFAGGGEAALEPSWFTGWFSAASDGRGGGGNLENCGKV